MKLVTFATEDGAHIGALLPGEAALVDFTAARQARHFNDMLSLIDGGEPALEEARALLASEACVRGLDTVRLMAPVPVPRQMYDCLTFEKHLMQARGNRHLVVGGPPLDLPPPSSIFKEIPVYYKPNRFGVVGTGEDIVKPRYANWLDYELEFGVFLGRSGKDITPEDAWSHIFGYCIFNDVSARDQQVRESSAMLGPSKGKDFDTGNVMGPWLVTRDEIPDPLALTMKVCVNGEERCRATSGEMLHSFADIIAHASMDQTLHAGEFFASGTVGGGSGLEFGKPLAHGDVIEMEIEGLGQLRNRVVFQD